MHEDQAHGDPLAMEALLYASGELEGQQRAAFEERLSADQNAREALCQAVELSQSLVGRPPRGPTRSYRARVRERLCGPGLRRYRGHPLAWAVLGAAASVLVMLSLQHAVVGPVPVPVAVHAELIPASALPGPAASDQVLEVANTWARLSNNDHLERIQTDEARRKQRLEHPLRPASATTMKN